MTPNRRTTQRARRLRRVQSPRSRRNRGLPGSLSSHRNRRGQQVAKKETSLRYRLLLAQSEIVHRGEFPVILLTAGMPGAGVGGVLNHLNRSFDNRDMATHAFAAPSEEQRQRPAMWRYWRALPPKGRFAIFVGAWYDDAFLDFAGGRISDAGLDERLKTIAGFERQLAAEGALIVKMWYPIGREAQYQRLRSLEADPEQCWRVSEIDWLRHAQYEALDFASSRAQQETHAAWAPWHCIAEHDPSVRAIHTATIIAEACERRLAGDAKAIAEAADLPAPSRRARHPAQPRPPAAIKGTKPKGSKPKETETETEPKAEKKRLDKSTYRERLAAAQARLDRLTRAAAFQNRAAVVVFEGQDAAGKGGAIHRLTEPLDPRRYRVVRVGAPTDEEHAQPWLWRFWRHLPPRGRLAIFDRSWYGRVLVERVEGLASRTAWQRAYHEINAFESQLLESQILVVKMWLQIDADEQLRRFKARKKDPYKRHKLTDEDWRNREKWDDYAAAVADMIAATHSRGAPWLYLPANDKRTARVQAIEHLAARIEEALDLH
nr:polyphosphate:AMP phosphotransferase [Halorhodospira abdelmalekii]